MRKLRQAYASKEHAEEASINLTPLIDVVFVVLIIFILIAPLLELDRIQLASAAPKDARSMQTVQENSPLAIRVHKDNTIWFNNRAVSAKELLLLLKEAHEKNPHKVPQLYHDRKAYFESYQTVKNAAEMAGFEQLDVILQPG
ncbi:MAG TPA: biopolymer transporter ExbD [Rhabdochlamydiaceae bacterium]|jgi:biopolymer transport protein ExbD